MVHLKVVPKIFVIVGFMVLNLSQNSVAQGVIEKVIEASSETPEGESGSSASSARQRAFENAVRQASFNMITNMIGAKKLEAHREIIESKILKNSRKYVLSLKGENYRKKNGGLTADVTLKISKQSLSDLLLEAGLLYKFDGPPKILPLVQLEDRVRSSKFQWWVQPPSETEENSFLAREAQKFFQTLKKQFKEKGFYGQLPVKAGYSGLVPKAHRLPSPQTKDLLFLGKLFKSQIVIKGRVRFQRAPTMAEGYKVDITLKALHTENGRVIGEVTREYETSSGTPEQVIHKKLKEVTPDLAQDLSVQLYEAWKSGTFGASLVKLVVNGSLSYRQMSELKEKLKAETQMIKTVRERLLSPDKTVFELDTAGEIDDVAQQIQDLSLNSLKLKLADQSKLQLTFEKGD